MPWAARPTGLLGENGDQQDILFDPIYLYLLIEVEAANHQRSLPELFSSSSQLMGCLPRCVTYCGL